MLRRPIVLVACLTALCTIPAAASADYRIPPDNPFVGTPGAAPEIYSLGLRNPFRFSFDRATGDLTIGDVGQGAREEIDFVAAGGARGGNFQWACSEGKIAGPKTCPPLANSIAPAFDYPNPSSSGAAVTGGVVIRDPAMPSFVGRYVYADYFQLPIRSISLPAANDDREEAPAIGSTVAFGEDAAGGVYAVSLAGDVWKLGEAAGDITATLVTSVDAPMNLAAPPGDASRIFIVQREGQVILRTGGANSTFLDISSQVSTDGEQGMSSIAFAPDYATTGRFYVFYTDPANMIRVDEFRRSAGNPNVADPASQRHVLTIDHTASQNHYGGQIKFGPDDYLYVATGDGGGGDDEFDNAQNLSTLLGKMLRIDPVPASPPVAAPPAPPADTTAPRFHTKTRRRQRVLRLGGVVVYARCPGEGCAVSLTARLRVGKLSYPLKAVKRTIAMGKRARLKAKLTKRAKRALRKGLRGGAKLRVDVGLRARDAAGNLTKRHKATVRVRR